VIVALHSIIRAGREEDYDTEHRTVWPELASLLRKVGIADWKIWRSGSHLFHVVDCDDFDAAMAKLDASELNDRWQRHINTIVDHFVDGPSGMALASVWSLAGQLDGGPTLLASEE
jgi:L-rhamnose mutarotase